MTTLNQLRVVIASPNDVKEEREALDKVINKVNNITAESLGLVLKGVRWETDSYPGFHIDGPQGLIDPIIKIEDCDILICIFWKRFGTPIKEDGKTGTEHEFYKAYEAWKQNNKPHIMLYFSQKAYSPKEPEELEQHFAVLKFKKNIPKEGLYWDYDGIEQFKEYVYDHITKYLQNKFKTETNITKSQNDTISDQETEKLLENYKNLTEKKVSKIRVVDDKFKYEPKDVLTELQIIEQYQRSSNEQRNEYDDLMKLEMNPLSIQYDKLDEKQDKTNKMIKPDDLLRSNKGIIIVGSSGSGKSTILQNLTFKILHQNERFPIYLELKSIQRYDFQNVKNFEDVIFTEGVISPLRLKEKEQQKKIIQVLNYKLQNGNITFLLDGLDEIIETTISDIPILDMFDEFMQYSVNQNNQVITTTRPYAWKNRRASYPVQEIEILPFNMKQIKQFVDHYYHDNPDANKFLNEISTSYELQEIAKNPLILRFIIEIYFTNKKLSKNKLNLYDQIITNLYDEEIYSRIYSRREFLNQLAFHRLFNFKKNFVNRLVFSSYELFREVDVYCNERPNLQSNADHFFDGIRRSNLLRKIGEEKYSFIHLIIQEYLAARILSIHQNITTLFCQAYFDTTLCEMEVLPMTLGFTSNNDNNANKENLYEILEKLPESLNFVNLRIRARGLRYAIKMEKYLSSMTSRLIEFVTNNNIDQSSYKEIILRAFSGLSEENRIYISGQLLKLVNKYYHQSETSFSINNVINALGRLQAKEAISELIALLKDEDREIRLSAANSLGQLHAKEAVPELITLLRDKDYEVRQSAADVLGQLQAKESIPELIALLRDNEYRVRQSAADVLGQLQAKESIPELIALLKDEDAWVRQSAADVLGQLQAKESIPELIALLKDEDAWVRLRAADVLGQLQAKESIPELIALLKDEDAEIRLRAANALGQLQAKESIPELIALLKDEDAWVRQSAANALGQLQAKESIPELIALLKDEDVWVRQSAANALGQLHAKEAVP